MSDLTLRSTCVALALAVMPLSADAQSNDGSRKANPAERLLDRNSRTQGSLLRPDSTIGDILGHPSFTGVARHVLPWDGRAYDANMKIIDIGGLLPYHTHVEPSVVVGGLNRIIADANDGKIVFFDIYTDAMKQADPTRQNTGLFFLRGRPGAPFAVIAPGGGFAYVGSVHEGFPYAVEINRQGYNAFVLKYRTGQGGAVANEDLAAALNFIMRNAKDLDVSTGNYSLWGSSAGARMAASIGSHGAVRFGGDAVAKPAAVVMAYTAHSDTSSDEPPTFVLVGDRDGIAPASAMERRVSALRGASTPVDYRVYKDLGHGFGTGVGTSAQGWIGDAVRFWERFMRAGEKQ